MSDQLLIALPPELKSFFQEKGYTGSLENEFRSRARLKVRAKASIEFTGAPAALTDSQFHDSPTGTVLVKDLSQTGIAVLYHEQIFPGEAFNILFRERLIETIAVRCSRLGSHCYEIGGQIQSLQQA